MPMPELRILLRLHWVFVFHHLPDKSRPKHGHFHYPPHVGINPITRWPMKMYFLKNSKHSLCSTPQPQPSSGSLYSKWLSSHYKQPPTSSKSLSKPLPSHEYLRPLWQPGWCLPCCSHTGKRAENCQQAGMFTWSCKAIQLHLSDFFVISLSGILLWRNTIR